jgi:hypothetical protein
MALSTSLVWIPRSSGERFKLSSELLAYAVQESHGRRPAHRPVPQYFAIRNRHGDAPHALLPADGDLQVLAHRFIRSECATVQLLGLLHCADSPTPHVTGPAASAQRILTRFLPGDRIRGRSAASLCGAAAVTRVPRWPVAGDRFELCNYAPLQLARARGLDVVRGFDGHTERRAEARGGGGR